ncbi:hypothetical protein SAMN05444672_14027 [Bacillus sp. OK838]|nr:hypothetical protein SAMN05444672_14027 [Bacillus sp. OK838]
MDIRKFGYIRVSSKVENEGRQLQARKKRGLMNELSLQINKVGKILRTISIIKTDDPKRGCPLYSFTRSFWTKQVRNSTRME